jgi:hypothetical protein
LLLSPDLQIPTMQIAAEKKHAPVVVFLKTLAHERAKELKAKERKAAQRRAKRSNQRARRTHNA